MSCYVALAIAFEMHICSEHTHSENRFGNTLTCLSMPVSRLVLHFQYRSQLLDRTQLWPVGIPWRPRRDSGANANGSVRGGSVTERYTMRSRRCARPKPQSFGGPGHSPGLSQGQGQGQGARARAKSTVPRQKAKARARAKSTDWRRISRTHWRISRISKDTFEDWRRISKPCFLRKRLLSQEDLSAALGAADARSDP